MAQGAVDRDVTKDVPLERPAEKLAAKLITDEHLKRILKVARSSRTPYTAEVSVIAYDLVLRLSEVCAMRCSWVDLERGRLVVQATGSFQTKFRSWGTYILEHEGEAA